MRALGDIRRKDPLEPKEKPATKEEIVAQPTEESSPVEASFDESVSLG